MSCSLEIFADGYLVFRHKRGARLEVIHEWLIFEFTTETTWIADAVPGFDADERCLLAVWTPKGNNGCTKVNGYLRLTVSTQEFGTVELALVDLDGIVAPGVIGKLHETILCFDEGH
ncbi:MAG: hypothetical protein IKR05_13175, partial [Prevotella sp.]|nr:hypothetical protein [Prevotella sp.]